MVCYVGHVGKPTARLSEVDVSDHIPNKCPGVGQSGMHPLSSPANHESLNSNSRKLCDNPQPMAWLKSTYSKKEVLNVNEKITAWVSTSRSSGNVKTKIKTTSNWSIGSHKQQRTRIFVIWVKTQSRFNQQQKHGLNSTQLWKNDQRLYWYDNNTIMWYKILWCHWNHDSFR